MPKVLHQRRPYSPEILVVLPVTLKHEYSNDQTMLGDGPAMEWHVLHSVSKGTPGETKKVSLKLIEQKERRKNKITS